MAPTRKKKGDPSTQSVGEMSDASSKPRANGVKTSSAHKLASAKNPSSSSAGKDKLAKKSTSKKIPSSSKNDTSSKKKQKRSTNDGTSPSAAKKRKSKSESGAAHSSNNNAGMDGDSSDEDDGTSPRIYSQLPAVSLNLILGGLVFTMLIVTHFHFIFVLSFFLIDRR